MSQTKAQLIDTLIASLLPASDSSVDIGSNGVRFANIYGDTLYGDGSNLTGITSTTINSNADNRLITGSGTANTLNGESGLTFDGTTLDLTATSGKLRINSTGPAVHFIDTNSDSDFMAQVDGGVFKIVDLTNSETTRLVLNSSGQVGINETNPTEMLHIKDDGNTDSFGGLIIKSNNNSVNCKYGWRGIDGSGDVRFAVGGTEMMRVLSSGKVGLGRTSADEMLHITADDNTDGFGGIKIDANNGSIQCKYGWLGVSGSNSFRMSVAGSERMRIDSSGRLLIGTTASRTTNSHVPALQVSGPNYSDSTVQIISNTNGVDGAYLFFGKQRSGSPGGNTIAQNGDIVGQLRFSIADGTDMENQCAQIEARVDGTPGSNDTPGRLQLYTTPDGSTSLTERMRIDSSGNVGIGTTSPSQLLHVNGITQATQFKLLDNAKAVYGDSADLEIYHNATNTVIQNGEGALQIITTTGDLFCRGQNSITFNTAGNNERMRINSSGNVGIGTTTPGQLLSLKPASGQCQQSLTSATNQSCAIYFGDTDSVNRSTIIHHNTGDYLAFGTAASERMRINSSGCLSVGTTDTSVAGNNVQGISLDGPNGYFAANRTGNESFGFGRSNNGQLGRFFSGGTNVGSITVGTSTTAYNTSMSDRSKKKNFEEWTEDTLSLFKNLNPQRFNYKTENDSEEKTKGFIAQDLVDSFPEAYPVDDKDDKYWFNPSGMTVYLMKAMQEAITKIETLETKLAALEAA